MEAALERATPSVGNVTNMSAAAKTYDREADDVGNILFLEHINLAIPDQQAATVFYVMGLGLTRDPYFRVGISNMGINVGRSQFHMPTAGFNIRGVNLTTQRLRGVIGFVMPDLDQLAKRLEKVAPLLESTQFSYKAHAHRVDVACPWGNRFRCHAPTPEFGDVDLAIAYIEFEVPRGAAEGIARFYRKVLLATAKLEQQDGNAIACVDLGTQKLLFRETDAPIPPYDGHHIAIYVANHSGPHRTLKELNLNLEESNAHQYRFKNIVDPDNGKELFTLEHEVRSLKHPLYDRPLINRDPSQTTAVRNPSQNI